MQSLQVKSKSGGSRARRAIRCKRRSGASYISLLDLVSNRATSFQSIFPARISASRCLARLSHCCQKESTSACEKPSYLWALVDLPVALTGREGDGKEDGRGQNSPLTWCVRGPSALARERESMPEPSGSVPPSMIKNSQVEASQIHCSFCWPYRRIFNQGALARTATRPAVVQWSIQVDHSGEQPAGMATTRQNLQDPKIK